MIGIYGGAFNPLHTGHLLLAEYIRVEFGLEKVLFVPTGSPPHKPNEALVSTQHRYNMVQQGIASNPFFDISGLEMSREGISYTSDTLVELTAQYPEKKLAFICGADSIINLTTWHNINKIFELAEIIVAGRPNIPEADFSNMIRWFTDQYDARITLANTPLIDISSTHIRERLKNGLSIRYMVPDDILKYIALHRLY